MSALLDQLVVGARLALMMLAVMLLFTRVSELPAMDVAAARRAWRLNATGWTVIAASALVFSSIRLLRLFERPMPHDFSRAGELATTGAACVAFILVIAARGVLRGLSAARVWRGVAANLVVAGATAMVGAWLAS